MSNDTDRGFIGWLEREEAERTRVPRMWTRGRSFPGQLADLEAALPIVPRMVALDEAGQITPEAWAKACELAKRKR
jgi:hypothetical protein